MLLSALLAWQLLIPTDHLAIALAHVDNPIVVAVMRCESGLEQWHKDGSLVVGEAGEIGIAQFKPSTWEWMNEKRGLDLDINNPMAQVQMIDWAFSNGLQANWTCYNTL